mgnify:CR=1 FL=1
MNDEHRLTLLRDKITAAQYTADLAQQRLQEAKDEYLRAALEIPASHPAGFQPAVIPVDPAGA